MKILITGGAGFIGSNFVHYMLRTHPDEIIVNLDKLTYCGNLDNLKSIEQSERYTFVKGDIADEALARDIVSDVDIIVNFAAESHVDRSIESAEHFVEANVKGVYVLLEAARRAKVKRFVQISTDEVYGSIGEGSFTEESPIQPNSPYSATKAAGDLLARSYFVTYGFPVIITRSSNNFGPYQFPEKIIPLFITNLIEGKKVPVYGEGLNIRDWLFVEDNCRAIDLVMRKGKEGEVYNIGGGTEIPNIDLTKKIIKLLGKDEAQITYVEDRLGHDFRYSLDCKKIRNELSWQPGEKFDDQLQHTVDWYLNNEPWWKVLKK